MGAYYFKQPNGLYGRFSTVVDTVTDYNMTKEELYSDMTKRLGELDTDVKNFDAFVESTNETSPYKYHMHVFEDVLSDMTCSNETTESAREALIKMGLPETEANKYYFMDWPEDEDEEKTFIPNLIRNGE